MSLQTAGLNQQFRLGIIGKVNAEDSPNWPTSVETLESPEEISFDAYILDINDYTAETKKKGLICLISIEEIGRADDLKYYIELTKGSCRNFAVIIPPLYEDYLQLNLFFGEWISQVLLEVSSIKNVVIVLPAEEVDSYYTWLTMVNELSSKISFGLIFQRGKLLTSNYMNYYNISIVILQDMVFAGKEVSPTFYQVLNKKNPPLIAIDQGDIMVKLQKLKLMLNKLKRHRFHDVFIEPLQPLRDNLELGVYEVFEIDKLKYKRYNDAIMKAVEGLRKSTKKGTLRALIVGSGRGPLIDMVVKAVKQLDNKSVTSIEKNGNCYDILKHKNKELWNNEVNLIEGDVRHMKDTSFYDKFDLVVSELLGSFGCNELCPEILQKFTYQRGRKTVMIPQSYHNYLVPIYSDALNNLPKSGYQPYLCLLDKYYKLTNPCPVFTFKHPNRGTSFSKSYTCKCEHNTYSDLKVNGFQGHFIAELSDDILIGNEPDTVENYCDSWYPMVFPIKKVNWCDMILYFIHRCQDTEAVWYEWGIVTHEYSLTYNDKGKDYKIHI